MKMKQLLTAFVLVAAICTAQAQVTSAEEMTIDAAEMTEANYPAGSLTEVTKVLNLNGTWDATQVSCLKKALKGEPETPNTTLITVNFAPDAVLNDMTALFANCRAIKTVVMPAKENIAPVSFRKAFYQNWKVESKIDLSAFSNITEMDSVFVGCSYLKEIVLPTTRNENPVSFVAAFKSSGIDGELDLGGFVNITNMNDVCAGIPVTSIKLPTEVNNNEVSFSYAFGSCRELTALDLSGFARISNMSSMCSSCKKLTSLALPTVENSLPVSANSAFSSCGALDKPVDLSLFTNITDLFGVFSGCSLLPEVKLSTAKNANPLNLSGSFRETSITTLDLSGFTNITNLSSTFSNCKKLTGVKFQEGVSESVENIGSMYMGCTSLVKADISIFPNVANLGNTFASCTALEEVILPAKEIEAPVNAMSAFKGCSSLTSPLDFSYLTNIDRMMSMFEGCTRLPEVKLSANKHAAVLVMSAFKGCEALSSPIDMSGFNGVKNWNGVFSGCTLLPSVKMPEDESREQISLVETFAGCTRLADPIDLSAYTSITDLTGTFDGCAWLPAVVFHSNLRFTDKEGEKEAVATDAFKDVNANCLKFLPEGAAVLQEWVEAGYANFIIGGQAIADMVLEDGKPFCAPKEFSLGQFKMTYKRDFTGNLANEIQGWNTICLPFDATLSAGSDISHFTAGEGYWLRELTGATADSLIYTDAAAIKANTPYIIALPGNGMDGMAGMEGKDICFTATDITIPVTPESLSGMEVGNFAYTGTYRPLAEQPMYLLTRGAEEEVDAFVYEEKGSVAPFRAHVTALNEDAQKITALKLDRIVPSDIPDGIGNIENDGIEVRIYTLGDALIIDARETSVIGVYTMDGRMVRSVELQEGTNCISDLSAGAYIVAGRKVIIGY